MNIPTHIRRSNVNSQRRVGNRGFDDVTGKIGQTGYGPSASDTMVVQNDAQTERMRQRSMHQRGELSSLANFMNENVAIHTETTKHSHIRSQRKHVEDEMSTGYSKNYTPTPMMAGESVGRGRMSPIMNDGTNTTSTDWHQPAHKQHPTAAGRSSPMRKRLEPIHTVDPQHAGQQQQQQQQQQPFTLQHQHVGNSSGAPHPPPQPPQPRRRSIDQQLHHPLTHTTSQDGITSGAPIALTTSGGPHVVYAIPELSSAAAHSELLDIVHHNQAEAQRCYLDFRLA